MSLVSSFPRWWPPLAQRLQAQWPAGSHLAIGYSGGLDSTVLLHLLAQLAPVAGWRLSAIHVNHQLNPKAAAWAEHCQRRCAALAIGCTVQTVQLALEAGSGVEAAARNARYQAFAQWAAAEQVDALLLAHHADDQAETVLLQLLRGGGVRAAAAMPRQRPLTAGCTLLRPLLAISRAQLQAVAEAGVWPWIDDDSNTDLRYSRNYLRHEIAPRLDTVYPAWQQSLGRAAEHFAEAQTLLDELANADLAAARQDDSLLLAPLRSLSEARLRNALRRWLAAAGLTLGQQQLQQLRLLIDAKHDAMPLLAVAGFELRRFQDRLYLSPAWAGSGERVELAFAPDGVAPVAAWQGRLQWQAAMGQGLRGACLQGGVSLRPRQGGERLRLHTGGPSRLLKLLFQEAGVPPWLRQRWPLLYAGDTLLAVPGRWLAVDALAGPAEIGYTPLWQPASGDNG